MSSVLWTVGAVALCVGLMYLAHRIEPHWVAKDGRRFLTTSEEVDHHGQVVGRRREVRGMILPDGGVVLTHRAFLKSRSSLWRVDARSPRPPRGHELFVMRSVPAAPDGSMVVLRMPAKSQLVGVLDRLATPS